MTSRSRLRLTGLLAAVMILTVFTACRKTPDMVLNEESMARLIVDLELADAVATDQRLGAFNTDSARMALRASVLAKHGVNEAVLDSSLRWYGRNLSEYLQVIDRADSIIADSIIALEEEMRLAALRAAGESENLWELPLSVVFARNQPSDFIAFEAAADSTWNRGDLITLELSLTNAISSLQATLAADYANRSRMTDAVATTLNPAVDTRLSLKLQLDSNITAQRIYGYLQLTPAEGERAFADSISLRRTRMVKDEYNQWRRFARRIRRHDL